MQIYTIEEPKMLGQIESYDKDIQTGVIKVDEEQFFEFYITTWTSEDEPKVGDEVDFLEEEGEVLEVSIAGVHLKNLRPVKSRNIAGILGILLGAIGVHRIYLGFYWVALAQIIVTFITGGFGVMWGFIEGILIYAGHIEKDAKGRLLK